MSCVDGGHVFSSELQEMRGVLIAADMIGWVESDAINSDYFRFFFGGYMYIYTC